MEEMIDAFMKKYDVKGTKVTYKNRIWQIVEACLLNTNIKLAAIRKIKNVGEEGYHHVAHIHGGDNNCGNWERYFLLLAVFINKMRDAGYNVFVINLTADPPDDVFDVYVGITK